MPKNKSGKPFTLKPTKLMRVLGVVGLRYKESQPKRPRRRPKKTP